MWLHDYQKYKNKVFFKINKVTSFLEPYEKILKRVDFRLPLIALFIILIHFGIYGIGK